MPTLVGERACCVTNLNDRCEGDNFQLSWCFGFFYIARIISAIPEFFLFCHKIEKSYDYVKTLALSHVDIISRYFTSLEPSDNLGYPVIKYLPAAEDASVTLICEVPLFNEIGKRKNVTYKIEWSAGGKTLKTDKICDTVPGEENAAPCPNATSVTSRLPGDLYEIGQSVSKVKN